MMKQLLLLFSILLFCDRMNAQSLVFAELQGQPIINTTGWNLTGAAVAGDTPGDTDADNNEIILTQAIGNSSGGVFYNQLINLGTCTKWTVDFDFRIFGGTGADGIAFCFLDVPPAGFVSGGGVGIPSSANGLKVVFDTYDNGCGLNPEIQIYSGAGYNECATGIVKLNNSGTLLDFIRSTDYNAAHITYDNGAITVTVNGTPYLTANFPINFPGYMGFTASTGGSNDLHSIKNATIYADIATSNAGPDLSYCTGDTPQIGTSSTPTYTYVWTPATGLDQTDISNPTVTTLNNSGAPIVQEYVVQTYLTANLGTCPTYDTVLVTIHPIYSGIQVNESICEGEIYTFGGQNFSAPGAYTHTFQSIGGCDSTVTLNLTVNPIYSGVENQVICQGETVTFGGNSYTTSGDYPHTFQTVLGCDSVVTLHLVVNPTYNLPLNQTICQGESFDFGGNTYTTPGNYPHTFQTILGCDSLVTLNLTVNPIFATSFDQAICAGEVFSLGGQDFTTSGSYTVLFQSVLGCDSAVTVNLTVHPIPEIPQLISNSPVPCPGDIVVIQTDHVPFGDYTWTGPVNFVATTSDIAFAVTDQNTGNYSVFVTVNGCNSPLAISPVSIQLNDQIHNFDFPNVITANQDNINDSLDIDPYFNPCVEYSLTIFNRWGEVVFEQNYGSKPFSGSDQRGNKLVDGVYFYKFVFREEERFGSITLLN